MSKDLRLELQQSQCKTGRPLLSENERQKYLAILDAGWKLKKDDTKLNREISFKNYHETMAFVNAVAWIANKEDHHPDLKVSYARCKVSFSTHDADGITKNDFICAAKIDQLID